MSLGLPVQHLLRQVVQDVAVAAGELRDEPVDVAASPAATAPPAADRPTQPSVRSPSAATTSVGKVEPASRPQQLGGLAEREPQVGGAQLGRAARARGAWPTAAAGRCGWPAPAAASRAGAPAGTPRDRCTCRAWIRW